MRILQVSTFDDGGGAEAIARQLLEGFRAAGQQSWLAVGTKLGSEPAVLPMAGARPARGTFWRRGWWRLTGSTHRSRGHEKFSYPGAWGLLDLPPQRPDIVQCHNLHRDYFDLRALPWLSRQVPFVLTLHDAWLLSGHCAHSFDCERWKTGCGQCPDLTIYPAISRDATARNWRLKRRIVRGCGLRLASPSQWLMEKARQSLLAAAIVEDRVIPNGVNLDVFRPGDQAEARARLGLAPAGSVLLFAAHGVRQNPWKDFALLREVVARVAERRRQPIEFIALGDDGPDEVIGAARIRFVPFERDPRRVAAYYRAADAYVHAARADTFPTVVLEATACGCPVVATAVGGIPEQIEDGVTGFLTPPGDAEAMARQVEGVLSAGELRARLGASASRRAVERYDARLQVRAYLAWFEEILQVARTPA
jgi:glycosyltransferase involved in cell wall biosynthesis